MTVLLVFPFILINGINSKAFSLCTFGHTTPNKYLAGKTNYFLSPGQPLLWASYNHPPETPNMTYIYEDFSTNESCWSFAATSSFSNILNEDYDQIVKFATCTICNLSTVPYPEYCPFWNISGYGIDYNFQITANELCVADDWNTTNNNTSKPLSICSWNISSIQMSEYYFMNDETWNLYTIDTNGYAYYYNSDDVKYMYQYYDSVDNKWFWAVSSFVGDANYNIFCEMMYENMDISLCQIWYFYDKVTNEFISNNNMALQTSNCPKIANITCVYESSNTQLNGKYEPQLYQNNYDGWKKDNFYLFYRDLSWYIATIDLSIKYASCRSSSPYNPMECNNKWLLSDINTTDNTLDTLKIWNSTCDTRPTSSPTISPTTSNPSNYPTQSPTDTPTYIPTILPTINPTTYEPTLYTSIATVIFTTNIEIETSQTSEIVSTERLPLIVANKRLSTDTFMVLLGIVVLLFMCCFFGVCVIVCWFCNSNESNKNTVVHSKRGGNVVLDAPRFRETLNEYMTQHFQDNFDQLLRKSVGDMVKQNKSMEVQHHYDDRKRYMNNNEGKRFYANNQLYVANDNACTASCTSYISGTNDIDAMTQSFATDDSPQQYIQERVHSNNSRYGHGKLRRSRHDIYDDADSDNAYNDTSSGDDIIINNKTHVYNIVINEDDVLDEEEYNRQMDEYNIHGQAVSTRKSIGGQSAVSKITDASFGSNQTEEKEDNLFYNTRKYKMNRLKLSKELLSKQPIEVAIFPEDGEGVETIQNMPDLARNSIKLTPSSSDKKQQTISVSQSQSPLQSSSNNNNMTEIKSLYINMNEKNKALKEHKNENEVVIKKSPPTLKPPPNSEIESPSTSVLLSGYKSSDDIINHMHDIDIDDILNIKSMQQNENRHRKSLHLNNLTPKRQSISGTHKSGRSFVTLFDEKKQIEHVHNDEDDDDLDDDLDDMNDNNLDSGDNSLDLHDDDLEESNTEDLSKQLFGTHSVSNNDYNYQTPAEPVETGSTVVGTEITINSEHDTITPSPFQHTLQSQMIQNKNYNKNKSLTLTTHFVNQFSNSFEISEMSQLHSPPNPNDSHYID